MSWLEENFRLDGKVALVTGASSGLGRAMAAGLSGAGATLALSGTSQERLAASAEAMSGPAEVFRSDLSQGDAPAALIQHVHERFGRLDILVNAAGFNRRKLALTMTDSDYDELMALQSRAAFILAREAGRIMVAQGGGKVILVGSLTNTLALSGVSVYGMAKAAVGQLTRTLAVEWAPHNVQVNCIAPGFFRTAMTEEVWTDPRRKQWLMDHIPAQRGGKPEELAGLCVFLASPASDYVTGQTIAVDGGVLAGPPGYTV